MLLAIGTYAEKINSMAIDAVACFPNHTILQRFHFRRIGIPHPVASCADNMRVRIGMLPVIAIAALAEFQFHNQSHFLGQGNRLVYRGTAGHGKINFDTLVNLIDGWMGIAVDQYLQNCKTLRCNAMSRSSHLFGK